MAASMTVSSPLTSKLSTASFKRIGSRKPPHKAERTKIASDNICTDFIERKHTEDREFACTPFIVEFRRLLQSTKYAEAIPGVSNRDLLHATIALYDNCLPDITPEVLYSTVCEKWATTVLLLRTVEDVVEDYSHENISGVSDHPDLTGLDPSRHGASKSEDLYSLEYRQINGDLADSNCSGLPFSISDINCNTQGLACTDKCRRFASSTSEFIGYTGDGRTNQSRLVSARDQENTGFNESACEHSDRTLSSDTRRLVCVDTATNSASCDHEGDIITAEKSVPTECRYDHHNEMVTSVKKERLDSFDRLKNFNELKRTDSNDSVTSEKTLKLCDFTDSDCHNEDDLGGSASGSLQKLISANDDDCTALDGTNLKENVLSTSSKDGNYQDAKSSLSQREQNLNKDELLCLGCKWGKGPSKSSNKTYKCPDDQDSRISPEGGSSNSKERDDGLSDLKGSGDRVEEKKGMFAEVFSDSESDASSSSEGEDEDFSEGADIFLKLVKDRREKRKKALESGGSITPYIGIESRLVGCATWEKSHVCPGEATIQIDLLAVRRRYRKSGVGKYLLQKLKDPSLVGRYDALVVYADHSAVNFFSGYGFSDDIVLNSKYSELADNWTNCTLMCYIPPFTGQSKYDSFDETLDLKLMDLEIQRWTLKSREAYQAQTSCLMRLRHEIIALQALVSSQKDVISSLTAKLDRLHVEKQEVEKKNLLQRIVALKAGVDLDGRLDDETGYHEWDDCEGGEAGAHLDSSSERRLHDLETESDIDGDEELIDWTVAEEFTFAMREDKTLGANLSVIRTKKAHPSQHTVSLHVDWCKKLNDPAMKTRMYFCGSLSHPDRIDTVLENGFSSLDFSCGEYGTGLYFSQHPSTAAHFSALGKILLAEVAIGTPEAITKEDRTRTAPSRGFDSIILQEAKNPTKLSMDEHWRQSFLQMLIRY